MQFKQLLVLALATMSGAQQVGTQQTETHPSLSVSSCTTSGGCTSESKSIVLDSNWRWTHTSGTTDNCYEGNTWSEDLCSGECTDADAEAAAKSCVLEGGDYEGTYGITTKSDSMEVDFVTEAWGKNIGSRSYLLDSEDKYLMFKLKNQEFTFDIDVSNLPCGLNGALYFVEMDEDGGATKGDNAAGAKYGTGYCDAQCPHDLKYIDGEANIIDWVPSDTDVNAGTGKYGTCCTEMDIWEGNSMSQAYTPHTCSTKGQTRCEGTDCGDIESGERYQGLCDKDGCDFAPFRLGDESFFGPGSNYTVDTTKVMTVVTQFITSDGTADGDLVEIRRKFVQDGVVIDNPTVQVGDAKYDSVTDDFCADAKQYFNGTGNEHSDFSKHGGLKAMGESMARGHVLVLSLWDDHAVNMLWLDSYYPTDEDLRDVPGVKRGPCSVDSGKPDDVETNYADSNVIFSNVRYGDLDSTYSGSEPSGNVCDPTQTCNVCDACCKSYLSHQDDCDTCASSECA